MLTWRSSRGWRAGRTGVLTWIPPWGALAGGVLSSVPGRWVGLRIRLLCRWVPSLVRGRIPLRRLGLWWERTTSRSCRRGGIVARRVGLSSCRRSYCRLWIGVLGVGGGLGRGSVSVGLVRETLLGRGTRCLGGGGRSVATLLVRGRRVIVRIVIRSCIAVVGRCVLYWWLPSWVSGLVSVKSLIVLKFIGEGC